MTITAMPLATTVIINYHNLTFDDPRDAQRDYSKQAV